MRMAVDWGEGETAIPLSSKDTFDQPVCFFFFITFEPRVE